MSGEVVLRDWQPGDGLRCRFASVSPIPCGPPVKTRVREITAYGTHRGRTHIRTQPLCGNHANTAPGAREGTVASITALAKRMATEKLIAENWALYQGFLDEFAEQLCRQAEARRQTDERTRESE